MEVARADAVNDVVAACAARGGGGGGAGRARQGRAEQRYAGKRVCDAARHRERKVRGGVGFACCARRYYGHDATRPNEKAALFDSRPAEIDK